MTLSATFKKKPVQIEAMQYTAESCRDLCQWAGIPHGPNNDDCGVASLFIQTLEGEMEARPGDWVIRGVKGEFYPCKPDIFAATYEPVTLADEQTPYVNSESTESKALRAMVTKAQWQEARPMELEPWYCHWVNELTAQGLHAKSDIATVLAILSKRLAESNISGERS